jgi:two-component system response regulator HydG
MRSSLPRDSLPEHAMVPGGANLDVWPSLLIVDDDAAMLQALVCYFEKRGFHVAASATLAEAKLFLQSRKTWTLVIADYHLPDGTGMELLGWAREQAGSSTPFLLMSGHTHGARLCEGIDYLAKPFRITELDAHVRMLLRQRGN